MRMLIDVFSFFKYFWLFTSFVLFTLLDNLHYLKQTEIDLNSTHYYTSLSYFNTFEPFDVPPATDNKIYFFLASLIWVNDFDHHNKLCVENGRRKYFEREPSIIYTLLSWATVIEMGETIFPERNHLLNIH